MKKKNWIFSTGVFLLTMSFLATYNIDPQEEGAPLFLADDNIALAEGSICSCVPSPYHVCVGYGGVMLLNMKIVCK